MNWQLYAIDPYVINFQNRTCLNTFGLTCQNIEHLSMIHNSFYFLEISSKCGIIIELLEIDSN